MVRWAFLTAFGISMGLFWLLFAVTYANINFEDLPWPLMPSFATSTTLGGFIGGIVAHDIKRAVKAVLAAIIVVFALLFTVIIISLFNGGYPLLSIYSPIYFSTSDAVALWYLPGFIYAAAILPTGIVGGYISRKYITVKPQGKGRAGQKKGIIEFIKNPLFVVIFVLAWVPLLGSLASNGNVNKDYSAWNPGPTGMTTFRTDIEQNGYTVKSSITSFSLLERMKAPFVLVEMGPDAFFNPISDVPFLIKFLELNCSLLVAHEEGSTSSLMLDLLTASLPLIGTNGIKTPFPVMFFMNGILRDNASYYMENDLPVITSNDIVSSPITAGVNSFVLNRASGLMMPSGLASVFGWQVLATSTSPTAWVNKASPGYPDGNGVYNPSIDTWDVPLYLKALMAQYGVTINQDPPQGGFPIPVLATTTFGSSKVICLADASVFSNEMINLAGFDNNLLAMNCINYLTGGNHSEMVVFDENHLRPVNSQDTSIPGIYGQFLDYVAFLSLNWFTAPYYPLLAFFALKRWLPKSDEQKLREAEKKRKKKAAKAKVAEKKARQERKVLGKLATPVSGEGKEERKKKKQQSATQKRTEKQLQGILKKSTLFTQKLAWYTEQAEYNRALELLYNRVQRTIGKKIGNQASKQTIIDAITDRFHDASPDRLKKFFNTMERISAKGTNHLRVAKVEAFEKIYYEMVMVQEYVDRI